MLNKDITPRDIYGQPHGYWEEYYYNGQLWFKGNYHHGEPHGYWEYYYWPDGNLGYKGNYHHGKRDGYWEYYDDDGNLTDKIYYAK